MKLRLPQFWQQVITVLGGTLGAQALPLAVAPLITRLCDPSEMGTFSLWLGAAMVAAIGATLRLETAMILDHEPGQQRTCFRVVFYTVGVTAVGVTAAGLLARVAGIGVVRELSWTALLTLGLGTWLIAITQTTLAYATSHGAFGQAARAKVWGAGTIALAQLVLLYLGAGGTGLLAGQLIGMAAGLAAARLQLRPPSAPIKLVLDPAQRAYLVKHQAFWRFSLPSSLLNALVAQLPLFLIGLHHGALAVGLFALTQRVLYAPIALLAASVLEVFKRQSVQEYQADGHCTQAYRHTFKALLLLGLGPSLLLFAFSPPLFAWIFGESWRAAGELAQILVPLYFLNFIASPLSYVFAVTGKQKLDLKWQVALFVMTVSVFSAPGTLHQNVQWYAIGYSLLYVVYLYLSWQCSQIRSVTA
jgi:O-antigen/teichoic acid export membrane protein